MKKIAILIPAFNEEFTAGQTLYSARGLLSARDIYVVDDGSSDKTVEVSRKYTKNVLSLPTNSGKATALNHALAYFKLAKRYTYIMMLDADTLISPDFFANILPILDSDKKQKIACVIGKVVGRSLNWITAYRTWEYEVAQTVHKNAQSQVDAVIVCPGCSTIYRSRIFKKTQIPTGTLAEDMDFTFLIHRKKLGKIKFSGKVFVTTQDPEKLTSFITQINRWYTGFWQCVLKHNVPWQGQALDVEVGMLALEGLFGSLITIGLFIFVPLTFLADKLSIMFIPLGVDLSLFVLPTLILTAVRYKNLGIFKFIPGLYFLRIISSLVFLITFLKVVVGLDLSLKWAKIKRYQVKERLWLNQSHQ